MNLNEETEALRRIPFFAAVDPAKIKLLAFTSERLAFPQGTALFREGDPGDAAYLILEGDADVIVQSPEGPVHVAKLAKHSFTGEVALICNVPRTATVAAASSLVALKIGKDTFFQLLRDVPQLAFEVMRELAVRLDNTNDRLRDAEAKLRALH